MESTVTQAFMKVPRASFLPEDMASSAYANIPLPIGFGQTSSQPETVELMLEWLEVEPGNLILDVGSGSGWTTALLAQLTGKKGRVVAVEIVPELLEFGRGNCRRTGIRNVEFHQARKHELGWPPRAPYDRILVSAAASEMPSEFTDQLRAGGRLVIPVRNDIWVIDKDESGNIHQSRESGFVFVPLIEKDGLPEVTPEPPREVLF